MQFALVACASTEFFVKGRGQAQKRPPIRRKKALHKEIFSRGSDGGSGALTLAPRLWASMLGRV